MFHSDEVCLVQVTIEPHLEMSYSQKMPARILFYCHKSATTGGHTPICDMCGKRRLKLNAKYIYQNLFARTLFRTFFSLHMFSVV